MTALELPDAWRDLAAQETQEAEETAKIQTARATIIGGTDMGPLVALYRPELSAELAKYSTAADVWMRLLCRIQRPETAPMKRGKSAEPRLRQAYADAYGASFEPHERPWVVRHPTLPWTAVSPDDVTAGARIYVEYKSTSIFSLYPPPKVLESRLRAGKQPSDWGSSETDEVPDLYQLQVQHGLEILGLPLCHLFVGFGRDTKENGQPVFLYEETRRYVIHRRPSLAAMALGFAERFHKEHILTRMPPSVAPKDNLRAWSRLMKEKPWTQTEAAPSQL